MNQIAFAGKKDAAAVRRDFFRGHEDRASVRLVVVTPELETECKIVLIG
jgi:hypothetical protein